METPEFDPDVLASMAPFLRSILRISPASAAVPLDCVLTHTKLKTQSSKAEDPGVLMLRPCMLSGCSALQKCHWLRSPKF